MADQLLIIRHGETEWSRAKKHTSVTDLPLTADGEAAADRLRTIFDSLHVTTVLSSPRVRALDTARRATGRDDIEIEDLLVEWDYGDYEGRTTAEIRSDTGTEWDLWTEGCPGGESPQLMRARMERLVARLDSKTGVVACFAHGHVLRALGAVWATGEVLLGRSLLLETGCVSTLVHSRDGRAIKNWNVSL